MTNWYYANFFVCYISEIIFEISNAFVFIHLRASASGHTIRHSFLAPCVSYFHFLTSYIADVITSQLPVGLSPCLAFSNSWKFMIGKTLVLFFTMKVRLVHMRFFNYAQYETLLNQVSPPTHSFLSSPETSTCLNTFAACTKIFNFSNKIFFLLGTYFLIFALDFEQCRHAQLFLIFTILRYLTLCFMALVS